MKKFLFLLLLPFIGFGQFNPVAFYEYGKKRISTPFASYKFENNVIDGTSGLNGTFTPATYTTGVDGNCIIISGAANNYVNIADNNVFSFTNGASDLPFSFKLNFKQTTANANPFLITKNSSGLAVGDEYRVDIVSGKIRFFLVDGSANFIGIVCVNSISLNTWYNLIITYDGSELQSGMKIYLNGVLQSTTNSGGSYTGMSNGTLPVRIGSCFTGDSASTRFIGSIDEVYFFNNSLTSSDISYYQTHYK